MLGQRWDHIGLIMAYLEPFWATLGPYWAHDEPFWAVCWPLSCQKHCKCPEKTAFLGCVADVFDAMLNYIFSFLLGHAALRLCWPYLKLMLSKNSIDVGLLLRPLESMLGRCRATLVHVGPKLGPCWTMLLATFARCWAMLSLCGNMLHQYIVILGHVGLILAHVGKILGDVGICWANVGTILGP